MTPEKQHHVALTALDDQAALLLKVYSRDDAVALLAGVAGRRRVLERHAPRPSTVYGQTGCSHCVEGICDDSVDWPCQDYRDAAAGLLPEVAS